MSTPSKTGAAALSIASNSALILLKAIAGAVTGSVALLTEALHSATDLIASIVAFFSVRAADVPGQLVVSVERREHGDRDEAAVALGEAGPLPDVAEEPLVGRLAELREVGGPVAGLGSGLVGHLPPPSELFPLMPAR